MNQWSKSTISLVKFIPYKVERGKTSFQCGTKEFKTKARQGNQAKKAKAKGKEFLSTYSYDMNFLKKSKIDGGFGICLGFMTSVILSFIFFYIYIFYLVLYCECNCYLFRLRCRWGTLNPHCYRFHIELLFQFCHW